MSQGRAQAARINAALTANAMPEDRALCQAAGLHDYLKPIRPEELVEALERGRPRARAAEVRSASRFRNSSS